MHRGALRVALVVSAALGASGQPQSELILGSGRVGPLQVGMSVDEVVKLVGRDAVRLVASYPEGMFQPVLEVSLSSSAADPALVAPLREWPCQEFALWGIRVLDSRFRTVEGIGVGSTLGQLRQAYPSELQVGREGGQPHVHVARLGLTFTLPYTEDVEDSAEVDSVWVVPQPVAVRAQRCPQRGSL
jgi:hypothetical protein